MKEKESIKTRLSSFVKGVGTSIGVSRVKNIYEGLSPKDADTNALRSDWESVDDDIRTAADHYRVKPTKF
jgi:hypothetical protein